MAGGEALPTLPDVQSDERVVVMGNFSEALAAEVERLRRVERRYADLLAVVARIRDTPGNDVERLKRIAREGLERGSS